MDKQLKIENEILNYLSTQIQNSELNLDHNTKLVSTGVLDSLQVIELIEFLEKNYQIKIDETEMVVENFDTINAVASLVLKKGSA